MKDKLVKITVETVPNGYNATIGKKQYHYFNIQNLLMGIAYHAVDDYDAAADVEEIANLITANISLSDLADRKVKEMNTEMSILKNRYQKAIKRNKELRMLLCKYDKTIPQGDTDIDIA